MKALLQSEEKINKKTVIFGKNITTLEYTCCKGLGL